MLTQRIARWTTAAAVVTLVTVGAAAAPASASSASSASSGDAHAELEGTIVRLADVEGFGPAGRQDEGVDAATNGRAMLQLDDHTYVPLDGNALDGLASGGRVRATVVIPETVAAAAQVDGSAPTKSGTVSLDRDALDDSRVLAPAAPTSALARASATSATSSGKGLVTSKVSVLAPASAALTSDPHELWVAVVTPKGVTGASATAAAVRQQVAAASSYWSDQSAGAVTMHLAAVGSPYTSAYTCQDDPFKMWSEAADRMNFTEGANRHLVMSLPKEAYAKGCQYGLASIGAGPNAGGVSFVADTAWPVLAHEFGHNLGLEHARALVCNRADADFHKALPSGCSVTEYGYTWDVMSVSAEDRAGSLAAPQAIRVGFMKPGDYATVTSGTRSFTLNAMSTETGLRAIEATDPLTGEKYYVEYRTRTGRDRLLWRERPAGVRVLRLDSRTGNARASMLLDPTPTGDENDPNRFLAPGATFTSYSGGVRVSVASTGERAAVTVSVGAPEKAVTGTASGTGRTTTIASPVNAVSQTGPKARFSWSGAGKGGRYDVRYRSVEVARNGKVRYGAVTTWIRNTTATSGVLIGRYGGVYEVSTRVAGSSTWSAWARTTIAVDASGRGVRSTSKGWRTTRASAFYGGTSLTTSTKGASVTGRSMRARSVSIVGTRQAGGGVAQVYVDGRLRSTIHTYARHTRQRQILATVAVPWGNHTVKVVNASTGARRTVVVDAFAYGR